MGIGLLNAEMEGSREFFQCIKLGLHHVLVLEMNVLFIEGEFQSPSWIIRSDAEV